MSWSLSGSNIPNHGRVFSVQDQTQVGEARRYAALVSEACGLDEVHAGRVGIIVNELGGNLIKYARGGHLIISRSRETEGAGVQIFSIDHGPGFADCDRVLTDGYTTGDTTGIGLGAVKRQSSAFDLHSVEGRGTVIWSAVHARADFKPGHFQIGAVTNPVGREPVCGDGWSVKVTGQSLRLIMVDGLGHGPLAFEAAEAAVATFAEARDDQSLVHVMAAIHGRLKSTRGAAVFLVDTEDPGRLAFAGVGNIRGIVCNGDTSRGLLSQNGTAGVQIRSTRILTEPWDGIGRLILHTDGILSRWNLRDYPGLLVRHPAVIAATLFRDFRRANDDATIVVIGSKR